MNRILKLKYLKWALFLLVPILAMIINHLMTTKPSQRDYSHFTSTGIKEDNHLTLFFIPSPYGISWQSPQKLFLSIARNYFSLQENFMGHVQVEVKCKEKGIHFFTGMRAANLNAKELIFSKQVGLGIIYHKFPGHLEDEKDKGLLVARLKKETGEDRDLNFMTFKINPDQCQRLHDYHQAYKENQLYRYYSLVSRPLCGEGAGCSAFGASFLDVIDGMAAMYKKNWTYELMVPKNLVGAPLYDQRISPFKFLSKEAKHWGVESDPKIFFWEPDKMYRWVKHKIETNPDQVIVAQRTKGLFVDLSQNTGPTKPGSFFRESDNPLFEELKELNKNLYR